MADDLRAGRLVRPFRPSEGEASPLSYYLVCPPERASDPRVAAFRAWLMEEIGRDGPEAERDAAI